MTNGDPSRHFPEGFYFGSSTAAHQVEGGNVGNDWWVWEHTAGSTAVQPSGDAIDQYHRYDEDFSLLSALGQNAHRLSLEWWRIEPEAGEFSAAALDHYRRVLDTLGELDLTAFVTLHHFTLPRWLSERGGWLAPDAIERFERYCERVARALGDLMPYACTINEPQIVALLGYLEGVHPPGVRNPVLWRRVTRTLVDAHRAALRALRSGAGSPQAGVCLQLPALEPARPQDPACVALHDELRAEMYDAHLSDLEGDFVGVQYYSRMRVDPAASGRFAPAPPEAPLTQMGWEIHPEGLYEAMTEAAGTGLPVVVTENGIATADDTERVATCDHISSRWRGRCATASTCAATSTGPRSTTSSGPRGTGPPSGSSASTGRTASAESSARARTSSPKWRERDGWKGWRSHDQSDIASIGVLLGPPLSGGA